MPPQCSMKIAPRLLIAVICVELAGQNAGPPTEDQAQALRRLIADAPKLRLTPAPLVIQPPATDWTTDYVSSVAADRKGLVYVLHRNLKTDPVLAVDQSGRIVRSWGRGLYTNPHSVRIDPQGNVWTVDSGSSVVLKFSPEGKQLLRIEVGEIPQTARGSRGTADIAFDPRGDIFIADGYGNAR